MNRTIRLAMIAATVLTAGCKDTVGPAPIPPGGGERGAAVTATTTEAGEILRPVTEGGAVLTRDFPAGAGGEALQVTLSPGISCHMVRLS